MWNIVKIILSFLCFYCNFMLTQSCVECEWVPWSLWTGCSAACGGGQRSRNRPGLCCREDLTLDECSKKCGTNIYDDFESETCNTHCYNGKYDVSFQRCICKAFYEGPCCEKEKPTKEEPDGANTCTDICDWTTWEHWSKCNVSCGGGGRQQRKRRLCCLEEYGGFENCAAICNKHAPDYLQSRACGDICYNSGTLNEDGIGCQCLNRTFGHCCEQILPGCTPFPTDVIFLLDSSVSQSVEQFRTQLEFVTKFVDRVNISAEEFQIAVITFSTEAKIETAFNQSLEKKDLLSLIRGIRFRPGVTFTDKGIQSALSVARDSERRKGMVTLTYAIVLTDGMSNNRKKTRIAAKELRYNGIHVVAIGIGNEVSHQELVDIASPGDENSPSYVFSVGDFNALDTLLKQLVQITCDDCRAMSHLSDIVFLLDDSNDMSEAEFQISLNVMTSIVRSMGHIDEENGQNIGLARYASTLKREIEFSSDNTQNKLIAMIQRLIRQTDGVCYTNEDCPSRDISLAINNTIDYFFNVNGRNNSRKFLIVLSNGRFENIYKVREEMSKILHGSNVKVFAIGSGADVNMRGLLSLVKEANHAYVMLKPDDTSKLDIMQSEFSYNFCK